MAQWEDNPKTGESEVVGAAPGQTGGSGMESPSGQGGTQWEDVNGVSTIVSVGGVPVGAPSGINQLSPTERVYTDTEGNVHLQTDPSGKFNVGEDSRMHDIVVGGFSAGYRGSGFQSQGAGILTQPSTQKIISGSPELQKAVAGHLAIGTLQKIEENKRIEDKRIEEQNKYISLKNEETSPSLIPGATSKEEMIRNIRYPSIPSGTVVIPAQLTVTGRLEQLKPVIEQHEQELKKFEPLISGNTFTGTPEQFQQYEKIHTEQSKDIGQYNVLVKKYNEPIERIQQQKLTAASAFAMTVVSPAALGREFEFFATKLIGTPEEQATAKAEWEFALKSSQLEYQTVYQEYGLPVTLGKAVLESPLTVAVPYGVGARVGSEAITAGMVIGAKAAGKRTLAKAIGQEMVIGSTTLGKYALRGTPAELAIGAGFTAFAAKDIAESKSVPEAIGKAGVMAVSLPGAVVGWGAGKPIYDVGVGVGKTAARPISGTVSFFQKGVTIEAPVGFMGYDIPVGRAADILYVAKPGVSVESAKTIANLKAKETVLRNRIEREGIGADKRDVAKLKEITEQIKSIEPTRSEPVVIKSVAESKPITLKEPEIKISKPTPEEAKTVYETKPSWREKARIREQELARQMKEVGYTTTEEGLIQVLKSKAEVKPAEPKVKVIDLRPHEKLPEPGLSLMGRRIGSKEGLIAVVVSRSKTAAEKTPKTKVWGEDIGSMSRQFTSNYQRLLRKETLKAQEVQAAEEATMTITGMKTVPIIIAKTEQGQKGVLKQEAPTVQISKVALVTSAVQETAQEAVAATAQAGITLQKGKQVPISIIKPATAQEQKRRLLIVPKLTGITKTPQLTQLKTTEKTTLKKPQVPRTPQIPRVPRTPPPKKPPVTKLKSEEKSKALNLGLKKDAPKLEAPGKPGKPNPLYPASYEMVTAEEFQLGGKRAKQIRERKVTQGLFEELKKSGRGIPTLKQYKKRKGKG